MHEYMPNGMLVMSRGRIREAPSEKLAVVLLSEDDPEPEPWTGVDLSGQGLCSLGIAICGVTYLTHLYLTQNLIEYIPPQLGSLAHLKVLDLSFNKLRSLPPELGKLKQLKELLLHNNMLNSIPFELSRLFQLDVLTLRSNPLSEPLQSFALEGTDAVLSYLVDNAPVPLNPPERVWIYPQDIDRTKYTLSEASVTAFCYNVLCDKYATRQVFRYCPSWALDWDYRRQLILKEILTHGSDIICLQEVSAGQFEQYFWPQLQRHAYSGIFKPKSRVRTMSEKDRESVDGCAIFYHTSKYTLLHEHLIEFERLATKHASGCADMLNRVMPKDNIALAAILESVTTKQRFFVCNLHLTWDPNFKDVKVIQMALALKEIESFLERHHAKDIPMLVMGDFNSMHDSGVFELMERGALPRSHTDLTGFDYDKFVESMGLNHSLRLKSAYGNEMPYSNYTANFVGIIDYIWYSEDFLLPTALLGPVDQAYVEEYVDGCPNHHFPSDHLALSAEFRFRLKRGERQ